MKSIHALLFITLAALGIAGCKTPADPQAFGLGKGPSMMYQPAYGQKLQQKYPLKVGIMVARDTRPYKFYNEQDEFFKESIPESFSRMMYQELKNSGLFAETVFINETAPRNLDARMVKLIASEHGVDMILVGDLVDFNLLREKEGHPMGVAWTFNLIFNVKTFSQLIHAPSGTVVWADVIERESRKLTDGSLKKGDLGPLVTPGLKGLFSDMRELIATAGLNMKR